jgi:N-acetylglucosamine kinase-like BadF-type ATPase
MADMQYFLGVDGGNTKTDYLLYTAEGAFVDVFRAGTCSHEAFKDGYDGMERTMGEHLAVLFQRNQIKVNNILAAGFGLAGADLPSQYVELQKRVERLGFHCYGLANDGILGIKGASDSGVGLCAVNGTGTVVIGIDGKGKILQVSGVGPMSGDAAGGGHLRTQIMLALYSYYYRCGKESAMFPELMTLLQAKPEEMLEVVSDYGLLGKNMVNIIQTADKAAQNGDAIAMQIFDEMGETIGQSAAGCIRLLSFDGRGTHEEPIDIVLVGSIWHRTSYEGMQAAFLRTVQALTGKHCRCISLTAPSAVGGVLWAKEVYDKAPVPAGYRKQVVEAIPAEKYDKLVATGARG